MFIDIRSTWKVEQLLLKHAQNNVFLHFSIISRKLAKVFFVKTQLIRNKLSNFTIFFKTFYYRIQKFVKTRTGKNIGFPEHCALYVFCNMLNIICTKEMFDFYLSLFFLICKKKRQNIQKKLLNITESLKVIVIWGILKTWL